MKLKHLFWFALVALALRSPQGAAGASNFPAFTTGTPLGTDFLVGYTLPAVTGAERRFTVAQLNTYFSANVTGIASSQIASLAWSKLTGTPTTLAGYGIGDSLTAAAVNGYFGDPSTNPSFSAAAWKIDLSLDNVNNTSDAAKPVSTATQTALNLKASLAALAASNGSGPNAGNGLVHWSQLTGVPAGFADGSDDGAGGGSGTVTSVSSGNIMGFATVAITNPTSTPAFAFTLASTTQNYVWAGPTSGSGAGGYRLLVPGDIPALTLAKISDAGDAAAKNTGTASGTVAAGDDSRITGAASAASVNAAFADPTANGSFDPVAWRAKLGHDSFYDAGNGGTAITITASTARGWQKIVLNSASCAVTLTGWPTAPNARTILLEIYQDATGGRVMTWPAAVLTAPTLNPAANSVTLVTLSTRDGGTTVFAQSDYSTAGNGDFSSNTSSSVDGEWVLFSGTGGKTGKRATVTGLIKATSGVPAAAVSGTDYAPATSGTGILKGDGAGGSATATPGTDYLTKATNLQSIRLTIDAIADGQGYSTTHIPAAFTVTRVVIVHEGAGLASPSVVCTLKHDTDRSAAGTTIEAITATSSTTGTNVTTGFDDATIPADSWLWVNLSGKSGTTANLHITIYGTYD